MLQYENEKKTITKKFKICKEVEEESLFIKLIKK